MEALAFPPFPPWNLPLFTVESTLSSPCSRSDPFFFLAKVRLSLTLTFSHLMIWFSKLTALFLFLLAKADLVYWPTALFVALRLLFCNQQVQYVQVFPLKPAPFCTLFAGLSNTNKSAISLLQSDSRFVLASLSSPPSFILSQTLAETVLSPSVLSGCNRSPDTRFSWGTTRLMSWPDGVRFLRPLKSLAVFLLSLVSTFLFFRTGGVLSHRNSLTHRFPRFPGETCAPSSCSLCPLSSTLQRTQPSVKFLSHSDWQNREFFIQRQGTLVPGHPSSHSALSSYGLFAPLTLRRLCLSTTSGPGPRELPGSWGSMVFRHTPIPRKGSGNQQNQQQQQQNN